MFLIDISDPELFHLRLCIFSDSAGMYLDPQKEKERKARLERNEEKYKRLIYLKKEQLTLFDN